MQQKYHRIQILIWLFAAFLSFIVTLGTVPALKLPEVMQWIVGVAIFATSLFAAAAALTDIFRNRD